VLVIVHDRDGKVLLLRRRQPEFWQSVTGSLAWAESGPSEAAIRELYEETGIIAESADLRDWRQSHCFRILPELAGRFAPGVAFNTEHLFSICIDAGRPLRMNPDEHLRWRWCGPQEALRCCWSWSNRLGIRRVFGLSEP
jgi:dihydroneopterin triphosphate diphosphatase